jgi:hypothetical protein
MLGGAIADSGVSSLVHPGNLPNFHSSSPKQKNLPTKNNHWGGDVLWSAGESFHLNNIIFGTNILCQQ